MSSCGCCCESRKCLSRQLLRRAPRFVNTAITSRVSTRTSCSVGPLTTGTAAGGPTGGGEVAAGAGEAAPVTGEGAAVEPRPGAEEADEDVEVTAGFGTGLTNSACHAYRTINARKIARRTRRSI